MHNGSCYMAQFSLRTFPSIFRLSAIRWESHYYVFVFGFHQFVSSFCQFLSLLVFLLPKFFHLGFQRWPFSIKQ